MGSSSEGDRPWQSYHTVYTNAKAGMDGVDKERVQRIVYEMSKGSKYFENEQRKDAYIRQKVNSLHAQCAKLTEKQITQFQKFADRRIMELEAERDLSKVWLHSDMDAFYAAVEMLLDPSLKGKPLAVGSMSMICTANYEARKYGVRAAMPGFIARKLCPELIFVPTNFEKYIYYSELTRNVFRKYDPNFIATSLDEAYLNITDVCAGRATCSVDVAKELQNAIYEETGLTCSVGVAPNRLLAKVCSDINKPNGQYFLLNDRGAVMAFISSLPIRKIGGIGKVTEHLLREVLGIGTCEEMLQNRALICALFSRCSSDFFLAAALGIGGTETPQSRCRKSISCERTFHATNDPAVLFQKLEEIAESLHNDMQKECLQGRTLTLKLKTESFEVRTRATSIQGYFHSEEEILSHAIKLLKAELPLSLRLLGLRISQFEADKSACSDPAQKTLENFVQSGVTMLLANHSNNSDMDNNSVNVEMDIDHGGDFCFSSEMKNEPIQCNQSDLMESTCTSNFAVDLHGVEKVEFKEPDMVASMGKANETTNSSQVETDCLTDQRECVIWLDDYICSNCGVELPPSFIEERQEHYDYHMATILQEEENKAQAISTLRNSTPQDKARTGEKRQHKKAKHSPSSHKFLPIDSFFVKSSKND